jgi:hypothetical protein
VNWGGGPLSGMREPYSVMKKKPQHHVRQAGKSARKWSARVTAMSDAMTLERGIFHSNDPRRIAQSVKRSSEHSHRRKANPYRSAISMISFYENRASRNLTPAKKLTLEEAKAELKKLFGKHGWAHRPKGKKRGA